MTHSANDDDAAKLAELLRQRSVVIVFAESCTAGLIAATLGRIAGISEWMAGSAVVYQIETKAEWLKVDRSMLQHPGPVSQIVSEQMALGVLQQTPQATIAASVTGHLGPNAPPNQDGIAWSSVALRANGSAPTTSRLLQLDQWISAEQRIVLSALELRRARQTAAVQQVLRFCLEQLQS